ncbi:MAG: hypothetical protein AAGH40_11320 [Verrucomicrobiota bacterium]
MYISIKVCFNQLAQRLICFIAFLLPPTVALSEDSESLPNGMELTQSYLEVNGGRANIAKIQSLFVSGQMLSQDGVTRPFKLIKKRPKMIRLQIEIGKGLIITYYDGKKAYREFEAPNGETQLQEILGDELSSFEELSSIEGPFYLLAGRSDLIKSISEEEVNGELTYKLEVESSENFGYNAIWLSQEHFQEVKLARVLESEEKELLQEVFLSDFDQIEGVYYAKNSKIYQDGVLQMQIDVERVRSNVGVFDAMFQPE